MKKKPPIVLTIAGSDPSGGAGVEADIKTLTSLNVYALAVITSQTVQNTQGVFEKVSVSSKLIYKQLQKLFEDFEISVVKIGMLGNKENIDIISSFVKGKTVIFDPVMYSKNDFSLTDESDVEYIKKKILPLVTILTPNYFELKKLSNLESEDPIQMAQNILNETNDLKAVLIKGGHINENHKIITDILVIRDKTKIKVHCFKHKRINSKNLHGTGCTLSSAISAYLVKGYPIELSVRKAIIYLTKVIKRSKYYEIGNGNGPLVHFLGG